MFTKFFNWIMEKLQKIIKKINNMKIDKLRRHLHVYEVPEDFFENPDKYKDYDYYDFDNSVEHTFATMLIITSIIGFAAFMILIF